MTIDRLVRIVGAVDAIRSRTAFRIRRPLDDGCALVRPFLLLHGFRMPLFACVGAIRMLLCMCAISVSRAPGPLAACYLENINNTLMLLVHRYGPPGRCNWQPAPEKDFLRPLTNSFMSWSNRFTNWLLIVKVFMNK